MFSKIVLTALLIGAISVNALTAPVARSPVPEPECESRRLFSAISNHGLTFVPFNSPTTRGPGPPQSLLGRNLDLEARSTVTRRPTINISPPTPPPSGEDGRKRKASQDISPDGGKKTRYDSSSSPMKHFTRSDHLAS